MKARLGMGLALTPPMAPSRLRGAAAVSQSEMTARFIRAP